MTDSWSMVQLLGVIGDNFPDSGPRATWVELRPYGIAAVIAALVAAVVIQVRKRNDMSEHCDKPWKLFRELCLVHGLDQPSQRLLARLARARQFAQPAEVFVRPQAFVSESLPEELKSRAAHLERLRQRLF
jgi:hypothetical protein